MCSSCALSNINVWYFYCFSFYILCYLNDLLLFNYCQSALCHYKALSHSSKAVLCRVGGFVHLKFHRENMCEKRLRTSVLTYLQASGRNIKWCFKCGESQKVESLTTKSVLKSRAQVTEAQLWVLAPQSCSFLFTPNKAQRETECKKKQPLILYLMLKHRSRLHLHNTYFEKNGFYCLFWDKIT